MFYLNPSYINITVQLYGIAANPDVVCASLFFIIKICPAFSTWPFDSVCTYVSTYSDSKIRSRMKIKKELELDLEFFLI